MKVSLHISKLTQLLAILVAYNVINFVCEQRDDGSNFVILTIDIDEDIFRGILKVHDYSSYVTIITHDLYIRKNGS